MATSTVESTKHTCDRDDCGAEEIVENGGSPVGYTGTATRVEKDRGGRVVTAENRAWFACKATHIRGAVEAVTASDADVPDGPEPGVEQEGDDPADDPTGGGDGDALVSAVSGTQSGERIA